MVELVGQFADADDLTEWPCMICQKDKGADLSQEVGLALLNRIGKGLPKGMQVCVL